MHEVGDFSKNSVSLYSLTYFLGAELHEKHHLEFRRNVVRCLPNQFLNFELKNGTCFIYKEEVFFVSIPLFSNP